ncbi:MAG: hypothetical protein K2L13_01245, partial [Opitutales bacterium]|nr:hypothetical protein [Opitutales bacterium]
IGKQFDPVTRGEYDQYLVKRTIKVWEEICDIFDDIKNNSCKFSLWIGWAHLKFVIKLIGKFNELLKLSNPEEAIKKGMPPEAFFAWKGIPRLEKKIDIENVDATYKLQLSYNPKDGLTANIIDSQNSTTPTKITTISSVESDYTLFCLRTENGRKIPVRKLNLLTIDLVFRGVLKGKVSLKQFFVDNNVPSFEDRAIIFDNGTAIKLSYDANSTSENDGISMYYYNDYTTVRIAPYVDSSVCLYGIRDGGNSPQLIGIFQMKDLCNLVNQLKTTENSNSSEQKGASINQFFRDRDAVPFKNFNFYLATVLNNDTPQFNFVSVNVYGNDRVNLEIWNKDSERLHTQNVQIKYNQRSDVVEISGQYWDKNEKGWKNFNNVTVNQAQLLQCKRNDEIVPNRPAEIKLVNFLLRNDALPSEDQTRTLTATQLDGPNSEKNNQEVQIEINSSSNVHVGDKTAYDFSLYRDNSCKDGEAIIFGLDGRCNLCRYKVKIDDLLGKSDNK